MALLISTVNAASSFQANTESGNDKVRLEVPGHVGLKNLKNIFDLSKNC
jgi:hypothetical protein